MWLVAGLGNPGEEYADTPHNLGFLVADVLAARHGVRVARPECMALIGPGQIGGKPFLLAKPQTYMNLSGTSLKPLMAKHEILPENLILVYDDLDLPWGHDSDPAQEGLAGVAQRCDLGNRKPGHAGVSAGARRNSSGPSAQSR